MTGVSYYTNRDLVMSVANRYRKDIDAFDYSAEYQMLRDGL